MDRPVVPHGCSHRARGAQPPECAKTCLLGESNSARLIASGASFEQCL